MYKISFLLLQQETAVTAFTANPVAVQAVTQQVSAYQAVNNDEIGGLLEKFANEVDLLIPAMGPAVSHTQHAALHGLLESLIVTRRSRDVQAAMQLLKKVIN